MARPQRAGDLPDGYTIRELRNKSFAVNLPGGELVRPVQNSREAAVALARRHAAGEIEAPSPPSSPPAESEPDAE